MPQSDMATIKIRGRTDALIVDDSVAKKIKDRKFGVEGHVTKAEPNDLLEISHGGGTWCGEYGRITEIDIPRVTEYEDAKKADREKERREEERWFALPAAEKAKNSVTFEVGYCTRVLGTIKGDIPKEIADAAYKIRVAYFEKNPRQWNCPLSEYPESILPPKGKNARSIIGDNMRVSHDES